MNEWTKIPTQNLKGNSTNGFYWDDLSNPFGYKSDILCTDGSILEDVTVEILGDWVRPPSTKTLVSDGDKARVYTVVEYKPFYRYDFESFFEVTSKSGKTRTFSYNEFFLCKRRNGSKLRKLNEIRSNLEIGDFVRCSGQKDSSSWRKIEQINDATFVGTKYVPSQRWYRGEKTLANLTKTIYTSENQICKIVELMKGK